MLWLLAFLGLSSAFQTLCLLIGGVGVSVALAAALIFSNLIILLSGTILFERFRAPLNTQLPAAYVAGFGVVSIALMIMTVLLGVSPAMSLLIIAIVTLAMTAFYGLPTVSDGRLDLALCIGIAIGLVALSASSVGSPVAMETLGKLPTWYDAYLHGNTIHALSLGGDIELTGSGFVFYHYAPFMLPAVLSDMTDINGLTLATSYLLPFGLWIGALGLYVFCCQLGGRAAAICAFALLVLIPGPSEYIIDSGWLDITWLLYASPGAGYATGLCFLAAALVHAGHAQGRWPLYVLAAILLIIAVFERVHFFMLAAPALLAVGVLDTAPKIRKTLIWITCAALLCIALLLAVSSGLRAEWIAFARPFEYLDITLRWSENYALDVEPYLDTGFWGRSAQLVLNLVASVGIFVFAVPLLGAYKIRRLGFVPMDSMPLFLVLTYLFLILFAPPGGNGDVSEYKHRHVILLYAAFVAMPAIWAVQLSKPRRARFSAIILGAAALVMSLSFYGKPIDAPNGGAMPWSAEYHDRPITPGILEAGQFLSQQVARGDVLTSDPVTVNKRLGPLSELLSLAAVEAYVSRGALKVLRSECHASEVAERLAKLEAVQAAPDWQAAALILREEGIRWYASFDAFPAWDPEGAEAALLAAPIALYDTQAPPGLAENRQVCTGKSE